MELVVLPLLLFVVLLMLSAFFSAAETALFSLGSLEKRRVAMLNDWQSRRLHALITQPSRTLFTILIGNMIVNTAMSCGLTLYIVHMFGYQWLGPLLSLFTVLLLMFGEIMPKTLAISQNVRLSYVFTFPLTVFTCLFYPFTLIIQGATKTVFASLHDNPEKLVGFTEEEMKTLVELGRESGALGEEELDSLVNIFSFGERRVKEIMVPRTDVVAFDVNDGKDKLIELAKREKSRFVVVYNDTIDTVLGVILTKQLLLYSQANLKKLLMAPVYIPELKPIDLLVTDMMLREYDCAICVDEYGGTAGVVTQDEMVKAVFGNIHREEYSEEEAEALLYEHGEDLIVDGGISLYELNKVLNLEEAIPTEHYDALSGFLLDELEEMPHAGMTVRWHDILFTIETMEGKRIEQVRICRQEVRDD